MPHAIPSFRFASRFKQQFRMFCSLSAIFLVPNLSHAACPDDKAVAAYIEDFHARRSNSSFSHELSLDDAACARRKLIAAFVPSLGPVIGYRAAFTNDQTRAFLQFDQPVWGAMYGEHLLASPAKVSVKYGATPYWDPDLLVEVTGPEIADAQTPMEALRHISAVIPFIGLKDNINSDTERFEHFVAINAGFRSGVLGPRLPAAPTRRFLDSLAKMTVVTKQSGRTLARAKGSVLMDGQPIKAAMWLAKTLKENGIVLKRGDLLGLGGFSMVQPPMRDESIDIQYLGLRGNPSVAVRFE